MKTNVKVDLISIYDARASFYGKAKIFKTTFKGVPGWALESYGEYVAFAFVDYGNWGIVYHIVDPNTCDEINEKRPGWSQTTNRHIREFCKQVRGRDLTVTNYGYLYTV